MKNEDEANRALRLYADTVRRVCFLHLKNYNDVEDVFQDVFLKYVLLDVSFDSDAHEKAWLIRVAINSCKDIIKSVFRQKVLFFEDMNTEPFYIEKEDKEILYHVLNLPQKYRNVVYLFYYEGYTAVEIAKILGKNENTIYTWLSRARERLKQQLEGESIGE